MGIIVKIDDIQPAFNNAHRVMWGKHSGGKIISYRESTTLPAQWWKKEYNVTIIGDVWVEAEFPSAEYLTWFMLRWS